MHAARNDVKVLRALIDADVDVNARDKRQFGGTALMEAAKNGKYENVEALIQVGADVNLVNKAGETALSIAQGAEGTVQSETCIDILLNVEGVAENDPDQTRPRGKGDQKSEQRRKVTSKTTGAQSAGQRKSKSPGRRNKRANLKRKLTRGDQSQDQTWPQGGGDESPVQKAKLRSQTRPEQMKVRSQTRMERSPEVKRQLRSQTRKDQ